jgi:hypothetical protein
MPTASLGRRCSLVRDTGLSFLSSFSCPSNGKKKIEQKKEKENRGRKEGTCAQRRGGLVKLRYVNHGPHWYGLHGIWDIGLGGVERQTTPTRPHAGLSVACSVQSLRRVGHPAWAFFCLSSRFDSFLFLSKDQETINMCPGRPRLFGLSLSFFPFFLHPTASRRSFSYFLQRYPAFDTLFIFTNYFHQRS